MFAFVVYFETNIIVNNRWVVNIQAIASKIYTDVTMYIDYYWSYVDQLVIHVVVNGQYVYLYSRVVNF